jgi:hypothetical protein
VDRPGDGTRDDHFARSCQGRFLLVIFVAAIERPFNKTRARLSISVVRLAKGLSFCFGTALNREPSATACNPTGQMTETAPSSTAARDRAKSSKSARTRVRMDPDNRERMILEGAVRFFAKRGFAAHTRELAEELGVSQSLVFHYFGSKEALIERVYQRNFLLFRPSANR